MGDVATPTRVQRVPDEWPVVHLEAEPAPVEHLQVDGLVMHPRIFSLDALTMFGVAEHAVPVHCVWGWSRPEVRWVGVRLRDVLDLAGPRGEWVTIGSASQTYSACLPIHDAARGILAWERDGEPLGPDAGGPLRFVAPPEYWAYKHVKWADRVTVVDSFRPGFWESKVADPIGRIPVGVSLP